MPFAMDDSSQPEVTIVLKVKMYMMLKVDCGGVLLNLM